MRSEPLNFTRRVEPKDLPEWMDEPCSYEDFRLCLLDLTRVNRLTFAYRPTLDFLDRVLSSSASVKSLRIVDVGCGGGDMLRRIERWAKRRGISMSLVGIDMNPYAARAAREFSQDSAIEWITGDAFTFHRPIDLVISSLFTHHLAEEEVVKFLAWSEAVAHRGWFVNDLARERVPFHLFSWWSRLMGWHRFVQHDGPVSFRRSFREEDWRRMLAAAEVGGSVIHRWTPARLCVGHVKGSSVGDAD